MLLADALVHNSVLRRLDLSRALTSATSRCFFSVAVVFDTADTSLGNDGVIKLSDGIEANHSLQKVTLQGASAI